VRGRIGAFVLLAALLALASPAHAASPAHCGPKDRVETGLQGQIPVADRLSGRANEGYNCNLDEVGSYPSTSFANFDTYGNCAYYSDTVAITSDRGGTIVLDVSDPRHPVKTAYLTVRAMRVAGESLRVNRRRGLLVADRYTFRDIGALTDPATRRALAVYDVRRDCRHPRLLADVVMPTAVGHEGCFQPDGMVYYMASTRRITPIDLSDPAHPKQLSAPWERGVHGCSTSDDGKRGYFAEIGQGQLLVADTSEVQARKTGAVMRQIAALPTPGNEGQQSTVPLTYGGHLYLLDWSEYRSFGDKPCIPGADSVSNYGYPVVLDMADEKHPKEVSRLQTEVMLPENCAALLADGGFLVVDGLSRGELAPLVGSQVFLYDSHYCSTDRLHDPTIVACASFGSGMRVYDIRDPRRPREIAYWNPGTVRLGPTALVANASMARPVIRPDLAQIWFPDLYKGFHVLQFREGVWPFRGYAPCPHPDYYLHQYDAGYGYCRAHRHDAVQLPSTASCRTSERMTLQLYRPQRVGLRSVDVYVNGYLVKHSAGRRLPTKIELAGLPHEDFRMKVVGKASAGRVVVRMARRFRVCMGVPRTPTAPVASAASLFATSKLADQALALCRLARRGY
jgi:hypothetical protein